jgi:hypothetical protein
VTFTELFWGYKKKASFAQVVHGAMARRERGTGPRPRNLEEDWERWGGDGWNQYPQYPQMPPPPHFFNQPPPPYGFYPNQPPLLMPPPIQGKFNRQADGPHPRGGGLQGRGREDNNNLQGLPRIKLHHKTKLTESRLMMLHEWWKRRSRLLQVEVLLILPWRVTFRWLVSNALKLVILAQPALDLESASSAIVQSMWLMSVLNGRNQFR